MEVSNTEHWNDIVSSIPETVPIVVKYGATWCGPCKAIAPKFEQLAAKYKETAVFLTVDIDDLSDIAEKFGINSVPTVLIFHGGKEVKRVQGAGAGTISEIEAAVMSLV